MATNRIVYEGTGVFYITEEAAVSYFEDLLENLGSDNSFSVCNMDFTKATKDGTVGWFQLTPVEGVTVQDAKNALEETFGSLRGSDTVTFSSSDDLTFNTLGE